MHVSNRVQRLMKIRAEVIKQLRQQGDHSAAFVTDRTKTLSVEQEQLIAQYVHAVAVGDLEDRLPSTE